MLPVTLFHSPDRYLTSDEQACMTLVPRKEVIAPLQVANWFGNRRIRLKRCMNKKEQFEGDMKHVYNPDGSIAYISVNGVSLFLTDRCLF